MTDSEQPRMEHLSLATGFELSGMTYQGDTDVSDFG
jgi:hypothetical protein